nr:putative ribonuclease H-like domain-containing protein [Tanacetum cinerariifolium]
KVFENDHTCVACKQGKQHRASCKTKSVCSVDQPIFRLYMDLFGPTFVKSLNKKSYCLVTTDEYSRFTWVFFLATKDETTPILKTFLTGLKNKLSLKVKVIRSDNGTEFKNSNLNQLCRLKGIKMEFSVPRTPKQNGIAERKNKTLIEAAKTMLADSLLPIPFWAEAVNTACTGPSWLFDIDSLTRTMNYQPVHAGHQTNSGAGFQNNFDAEKAGEEVDQSYMLFPVWSASSTNPYNNAKDADFDGKEHDFNVKKSESKVILSLSRYRDLNAEFQECSENSSNEVTTTCSTVPTVRQNSLNSTNNFSATGPSNDVVSPTYGQTSDIDASQLPDDLDIAVKDQGGLSQMFGNDFHTCMFACFLSQESPKRVHQALKDLSWIEAMQEELLQFKMQKVWVLVDLPYEKRAIGTK